MKGVLMEYDYSSSNNIDTEGQAPLIYIHRDTLLPTPNSFFFLGREKKHPQIQDEMEVQILSQNNRLQWWHIQER